MDYRAALDYVLNFADYERWPGAGYAERWDLRRMNDLLERLGSSHLKRRTVHIAGSKGKGSTAAMIASALCSAGFRTGLYTSPHLHTIRERIQVDGNLITEDEFAGLVSELKPCIEKTNAGEYGELSTFEILTALAFLQFGEKEAEFQVLEVGLGGRLDATNVVPCPDVCVITSISLDHTAVLGDTISQIAGEKAGIIKPGVVVVSSPQVPEAEDVIREVCHDVDAQLITVGKDITWRGLEIGRGRQSLEVEGKKGRYRLDIPLLGEYQMENAATAVAALEVLDIVEEAIITGLREARWGGRLQVLKEKPLLVADGAHNGDSARRLTISLRKYFQYEQAVLIIGSSADKKSPDMIAEFAPFFDQVITTTSRHPRAVNAGELARHFDSYGIEARVTENVEQAVTEGLKMAGERDLVCATGSLFLVAEVIEYVTGIAGERYPDMEAKKS